MKQATKKSIRLRILKLKTFKPKPRFTRYKKIDPFADTETNEGAVAYDSKSCYKKIDPFADTETPSAARPPQSSGCYKKIDPFADTETR